jgi:hypothetical protein
MSTSAEALLRDGRVVRLTAAPYDDPVARELVDRVQAEYTVRYGGPDAAVVDPAEFLPPKVLLDALELSAARAGHRAVVLNSGFRQPEALALYDRAGYGPVPGYGVYADAPGAVFLGKELPLDLPEEDRSWAS